MKTITNILRIIWELPLILLAAIRHSPTIIIGLLWRGRLEGVGIIADDLTSNPVEITASYIKDRFGNSVDISYIPLADVPKNVQQEIGRMERIEGNTVALIFFRGGSILRSPKASLFFVSVEEISIAEA